jgi:hypothetical protein
MRSIVEKTLQVQSGLTRGTEISPTRLVRPSHHPGQAGGGLAQISDPLPDQPALLGPFETGAQNADVLDIEREELQLIADNRQSARAS